jgi:hypothetical protein
MNPKPSVSDSLVLNGSTVSLQSMYRYRSYIPCADQLSKEMAHVRAVCSRIADNQDSIVRAMAKLEVILQDYLNKKIYEFGDDCLYQSDTESELER